MPRNPTPTNTRRAHSRKDTEEILGVSSMTLLRWERQGLITVRRVGGRVLIPTSEIDRLLGETP